MDDGHVLLKFLHGFSTGLIHLVKNMDKRLQTPLGVRFLHQVLDHLNTGKQHPLARAGEMRKQAMFDRIVFGTVRRIMRETNFHPDLIRYALQVLLENVMARAVAATTVT